MTNISEFKRGWQILLLAFLGVATSASVLPLYGFGALMEPLQSAFSWSRSDLIVTTSFSAFGGIFSSQLAGWLNNRFGMKPVSLVSFFTLCATLLLMTQMHRFGGSIWLLYGFYTLLGFAGIGTLQVTWTELVNWWFEKNRGLALAIILSGSGFMGVVLPTLMTGAMQFWDWRAGFVVLAVLPVLIALPLTLLWMRPPPTKIADKLGSTEGQPTTLVIKGMTYLEGIRDKRFWMITLAMILAAGSIMVVVVNCVPMLIDNGYSAAQASQLFGVFGLSLIGGRVAVGYLVDRIWAPGVACVVFLLSAVGFFLLATQSTNTPLISLAIALVGVGAGAEFDLAAFLVARFFGMRDYARLFGLEMGVLSGGICLAPLLASWSYGVTGGYTQILLLFSVFLVVAAILLLFLGRYPDLSE
jgi:MFS family permease